MVRIARRGRLADAREHTALVAVDDDGAFAGVLVHVFDPPACEVLALYAAVPGKGAGTALLDALRRAAVDAGCTRLWLITTNDNTRALRFYQRRGFRLAALHPGAVDDSRARLKPEIPLVGEDGIEIHDELELEAPLLLP